MTKHCHTNIIIHVLYAVEEKYFIMYTKSSSSLTMFYDVQDIVSKRLLNRGRMTHVLRSVTSSNKCLMMFCKIMFYRMDWQFQKSRKQFCY